MARPKKDQAKKYTDKLTKRITIQKIPAPEKTTFLDKGTFSPTSEKNADLQEIQSQNLSTIGTEMFQKMILLLKHYGIDPSHQNCWLSLSLHLACDHVEGFKLKPRSGTGREQK